MTPPSEFASMPSVVTRAMAAWTPPPRLSLSQWADQKFYLSAENAAVPGRWRTLPYQRGIMDAITDPAVERVSLQKSARIGYTLMVSAGVGYFMDHAPCPILVVQPTVKDAEGYSKETIAPMLRDVPALARIVFEAAEESGSRDSDNTILHKGFPGGVLSLAGANSGSGFRRVSRKVVVFDEVDAYPTSAGSDGDPIKLGTMRSQAFWDRKIVAGSTPLIAGASRIERLFAEGDQQRFHVPCPHCGHMAPFVFRGDAGHVMTWPEGDPDGAFFTCQKNGCVIEHRDKRAMVTRGEWCAANPHTDPNRRRHASFHIWTAYSFNENTSWSDIAREFLASKGNSETLRVFVNTWLGETWTEQGEAPEWERLYSRREQYASSALPPGVQLLTAGVDVQKDRFVYEVVGWGVGKESWSVDAGVIPADTSNEAEWVKLDELLGRTYHSSRAGQMPIHGLAVDSGYQTNTVYTWVRQKPMSRVIAVKGSSAARVLLGAPTPVDVTVRGRRIARGAKVWPVGVDVAKEELYGWLALAVPAAGVSPSPGFCHFPEYGEDYFKQLTAEQLVGRKDNRGFLRYEWTLMPGRENHWLDARVYARAVAQLLGVDRLASVEEQGAPVAPAKQERSSTEDDRQPAPKRGSFLRPHGDRFSKRGKPFLR